MLAVATSLSSCALATDKLPSVDVLDVRLIGVGLTEQQLAATLCVTNPNTNGIAFKRLAVTLDVLGSPLASGASKLPIRLPPSSSTVVPFTVTTTVRNIGPQLLGTLRSGGIDYRIRGTVSRDGTFGLTLPFSRSGHLGLMDGGLGLASDAVDGLPSRCSPKETAGTPRT